MECLVDRRPTFYPTAGMSGSMECVNDLWTLIENFQSQLTMKPDELDNGSFFTPSIFLIAGISGGQFIPQAGEVSSRRMS